MGKGWESFMSGAGKRVVTMLLAFLLVAGVATVVVAGARGLLDGLFGIENPELRAWKDSAQVARVETQAIRAREDSTQKAKTTADSVAESRLVYVKRLERHVRALEDTAYKPLRERGDSLERALEAAEARGDTTAALRLAHQTIDTKEEALGVCEEQKRTCAEAGDSLRLGWDDAKRQTARLNTQLGETVGDRDRWQRIATGLDDATEPNRLFGLPLPVMDLYLGFGPSWNPFCGEPREKSREIVEGGDGDDYRTTETTITVVECQKFAVTVNAGVSFRIRNLLGGR